MSNLQDDGLTTPTPKPPKLALPAPEGPADFSSKRSTLSPLNVAPHKTQGGQTLQKLHIEGPL